MNLEQVKALSDEELLIRVAKLDGWYTKLNTVVDPPYVAWFKEGVGHHVTLDTLLPNYPHDLNACHEFEMSLKEPVLRRYGINLLRIRYPLWDTLEEMTGKPQYLFPKGFKLLYRATARQRCEALVLTLSNEYG